MSENNINVIKSITTHKCPHCGENIFIENQMPPAVIASLFTETEIKQAKQDCLERVNTLSIDDDKKENVKNWLKDKKTIFTPNEVDNIINSLLKPEE